MAKMPLLHRLKRHEQPILIVMIMVVPLLTWQLSHTLPRITAVVPVAVNASLPNPAVLPVPAEHSVLTVANIPMPSPPVQPLPHAEQQTTPEPRTTTLSAQHNSKPSTYWQFKAHQALRQQAMPAVNIELPTARHERQQVIDALRTCGGVRLAKVTAQGNITAQESSRTITSPFVRAVSGALGQHEQQWARQWQSLPGHLVRVYPGHLDHILLSGLYQLAQTSQFDQQPVTARYQLQGGQLQLVNIAVNGVSITGTITLIPDCAVS